MDYLGDSGPNSRHLPKLIDKMQDHYVKSQKERFDRDGFAVIKSCFSKEEITEIGSKIDNLVEQRNEFTVGRVYFEPDGKNIRQVENLLGESAVLKSLLLTEDVRRICECMLGESVTLFKDKVNFKHPGGTGYKLHRDGCFWWIDRSGNRQPGWGAYCDHFLSLGIALDNLTLESGCINFYPGSNVGINFVNCPDHKLELIPAFHDSVPCPLLPGDIVVFDCFTLHYSNSNITNSPKRLVYLTFNSKRYGDYCAQYYADKDYSLEQGNENR